MDVLRRSAPLLACLAALLACPPAMAEPVDPPASETAAKEAKPKLAERFQKGPIGVTATVLRKGAALPLFQVPVLRYQDRLEIAFSGEAFDTRVTRADWTLVVVFLPRTVAPTERGVVSLGLDRKNGSMVAEPITVPYDSIPMVFLVPDSGGRRKILSDLNAHLAEFRDICLKLSDLSEQRVYADRFLKGLESIRQDQSAPSYDRAVFNFFRAYGSQLSQDAQIFLNRNGESNLERFQFLVSEFKRTNLLVPTPDAADRSVKVDGTALGGKLNTTSLYVAIAFDLMQLFQNLWPGHKFQYVPALARDFEGNRAQLWYDDWIRTTGDVRGALVFSPCRWSDAEPPAFSFGLAPSDCLLRPLTRLQVQTKPEGNPPFALFGHDWRLAVKGPGEALLEPLPLKANPAQQVFVIEPGQALAKLQKAGWSRVQVRIEGTWGFQPVSTPWQDAQVGIDAAWRPTAEEAGRFMLGQPCSFTLPAPWGRLAAQARFRRGEAGGETVQGTLKAAEDGSATLSFGALQGEAGPGTLEILLAEGLPPAIAVPLALQVPLPVVERVVAHQGESSLLLVGHHLKHARGLQLGGLSFSWTRDTPEGSLFTAASGALGGEPGLALEGTLKLADGRSLPLRGAPLMPPRPVLKDVEVIPQAAHPGLAWSGEAPLVSTASPVVLSGLSARTGRYPLGRSPKVFLRNAEEPAAVLQVPAAQVKLAGRGQRLLATFKPAELLGSRASGTLEWQMRDEGVGSSAWIPLPALFLELPSLLAIRREGGGWVAEGQGLELLEATATSAAGPWIPARLGYREGREVTPVAEPDPEGVVHVRLIGWGEKDLKVRGAAPVRPAASTAQTTEDPSGKPKG